MSSYIEYSELSSAGSSYTLSGRPSATIKHSQSKRANRPAYFLSQYDAENAFDEPWNRHSSRAHRPIAIPVSPSKADQDLAQLEAELAARAWRMYETVNAAHGTLIPSPAEEKALARYAELAGELAAAPLESAQDISREDIFNLEW